LDTIINKGTYEYISDCEEALIQSELGRRYFHTEGSARRALEEGFDKGEIYVALHSSGQCTGFLWIIPDGIFHSFPYLHIVAVKEEYRNQGIGKELIRFFEDLSFQELSKSKVFLVVADFNPGARRLYEELGYLEVGSIPGLYRTGITETIMMKRKPE
jgi:ribosomal protein S18 acetylase RimI-like enzyme